MESVALFEAESHLSQLIERVVNGEEFTIHDHGKAVARLICAVDPSARPDVRSAVEAMKQFRKGRTLGEGLTVRELIEAGRRF